MRAQCRCGEDAVWLIKHSDAEEDYSLTCTKHVGDNLSLVPEQRIYPLEGRHVLPPDQRKASGAAPKPVDPRVQAAMDQLVAEFSQVGTSNATVSAALIRRFRDEVVVHPGNAMSIVLLLSLLWNVRGHEVDHFYTSIGLIKGLT